MKHISRRDFIHAGCTAVAATLVPHPLDAARLLRGTAAVPVQKVGQTVTNMGASSLGYINIAKGLTLASSQANFPALLNSDGYPTGTIGSGWSNGVNPTDPNYYGRYYFWWTGTGALEFNPPTIVYSGGTSTNLNTASGSIAFNAGFGFAGASTQPTQSTPIEFSFGCLLSSVTVSNGLAQFTTQLSNTFAGGGFNPDATVLLPLASLVGNGTTATATTIAPHGIPVGMTITISVLNNTQSGFNGANLACTSTGANTFTYANATSGTATVPGTYSPSVAYFQLNNVQNLGTAPNADGSWTAWKISNNQFILPQSAAVAASVTVTGTGGPGTQAEAILSIRASTGNGLTVQQPSTVTYSWSNICWCKKANQAALIAGQLASPEYVADLKAMNPRFARFMDFGAVQSDRSSAFAYRSKTTSFAWGVSVANADYYAGTVTNGGSDNYSCSNPTASPSSGPFVDGEVIVGQISGANTGNNPTLTITGRSGISPAPLFSTTNNVTASQTNLFLTGTVPAVGTVIPFSFSGAGLSGTYTPTYTVALADSSLSALGTSLKNKFNTDATLLAANIVVPFNGTDVTAAFSFQFNPNIGGLGASPLVVSGTDPTSAATLTFGKVKVGGYVSGSYYAFTYVALIGGFLMTNNSVNTLPGVHGGPPLEFYADLCNRAGVGMWLNIGQCWSAARITSTVTALAGLLNGELKLEYANETWNDFENEWAVSTTMGVCLGLNNKSNPNSAANGFTGLRSALISQLAVAAWTGAGRSRASFHMQLSYQFVDMNATGTTDTCVNRMKGTNLNTSTNTTLASFGNYGATSISFNPSVSGSRPVDYADEIGGAPYWCGAQMNINNGGTTLTTGSGTASACTISGTVLTVGGTLTGAQWGVGQSVTGAGVTAGTTIASFGTGTGGTGTYNLNNASTVSSPVTMTTAVILSQYNPLLVASYNYANGNSTQQTTALDFLYSTSLNSGDLYNGQLSGGLTNTTNQLANFAVGSGTSSDGLCGVGTFAASFDTSRASLPAGQVGYTLLGMSCYEGFEDSGPVVASEITGCAGSLNTLATAASTTMNGYTSSLSGAASGGPASTAMSDAANMAALLAGFKFDARFAALTTVYLNNAKAAGNVGGARISLSATFGFEGPSVWAIYAGLVGAFQQPFQSVSAIQTFNN